jgi:hypothetical protein
MPPVVSHLYTYFLFPFSIDKQAVLAGHREIWARHPNWIEGLDEWISAHPGPRSSPIVGRLGRWRRAPYTRFDMDSPVYQDMVFFHPFVRRIFFDTGEAYGGAGDVEALLRCYTIPIPEGARVWFTARDARGRSARVEVSDLRMFLFANGIGILSIGIEAFGIPAELALWINETMRKVYPSSGRQVREGRGPNYLAFTIERDHGAPGPDHHRPALLCRLRAAGVRAGARRAHDRSHVRRNGPELGRPRLRAIGGLPGLSEPSSVCGPLG